MAALDAILSGSLFVDDVSWVSPSLPNAYSSKGMLTIENDASSTTLVTIGRQAGSLVNLAQTAIYVEVGAVQLAGTSYGSEGGAEFQLKGVWYRTGSSLLVVKAPTVVDSNPNQNGTAWTAVLLASGTSIQVNVTGDAAKTIRWSYCFTYYERS